MTTQDNADIADIDYMIWRSEISFLLMLSSNSDLSSEEIEQIINEREGENESNN